MLNPIFQKVLFGLGIVVTSSIAVSSIGASSVVGAFLSALFLGLWVPQLPRGLFLRASALTLVYAAAWLGSSWWLATGVYSMNQSYWWTGYIAAFVAALWGGLPYSIACFAVPSANPILRSALLSSALSVAVHCWPHPFNCTPAIGMASATALLQIVELGGLPLLFFLLHFTGFLGAEILHARCSARERSHAITVLLVVAVSWFGAGEYRFRVVTANLVGGESIRIGVVQPNIPIEGTEPIGEPGSRAQLFAVTKGLLADSSAVDLVVWPEIPMYFSPTNNPNDQRDVLEMVEAGQIPLLLNADMYTNESVYGRVPFYNTEQLFRPGIKKPEEYRKNLLIPIGEYLPFESMISSPETEQILSGLRRYVPGQEVTTFKITTAAGREVSVGTPICLELLNSHLVSRMVGVGAEVLVTPANDVYFRNEAAARLGLAFAAVRAVENRTPVVRVTNSGLTGWVGAGGDIVEHSLLPSFAAASSVLDVQLSHPHVAATSKETLGIGGLILLITLLLIGLSVYRFSQRSISPGNSEL